MISFASFGNALLFVLQAIKDVDLFILTHPSHQTAGNKLQVPSSDLACFLPVFLLRQLLFFKMQAISESVKLPFQNKELVQQIKF